MAFCGVALLAQWLERAAVNRKVTGSIPVGSVVLYFIFVARDFSVARLFDV